MSIKNVRNTDFHLKLSKVFRAFVIVYQLKNRYKFLKNRWAWPTGEIYEGVFSKAEYERIKKESEALFEKNKNSASVA